MNMPRTVVTMARCWYTRAHRPRGAVTTSRDGCTLYGRCQHCHRDIASTDRLHWDIVGNINAEAAGERRAAACLSVIDVLDEMVIARHPIGDIPDEAGVQALRDKLRCDYGLDDPESMLILRDSRHRDDARPAALSRHQPLMLRR